MNSNKNIQITAKKCIDDAWPGDYGGRSKWDINRFLPWKELTTNGLLREHIEAQFVCADLSLMRRCLKNPDPLTSIDEVRDIIRAVFYGHYNNKC